MTLGTVVQTLAVFVLSFAVFRLIEPGAALTRARATGALLVSVAMLLTGAKLQSASISPSVQPSYLTRISPSGERLFAASIVPRGEGADLIPGIGRSVGEVRQQLSSDRLAGAAVRTVDLAISVEHRHGQGATAPLATLQFDAAAVRGAPAALSDEALAALASEARFEGDAASRQLLRDECAKSPPPVKRSVLCREALRI